MPQSAHVEQQQAADGENRDRDAEQQIEPQLPQQRIIAHDLRIAGAASWFLPARSEIAVHPPRLQNAVARRWRGGRCMVARMRRSEAHLTASAPALATWASCAESAPDTPIEPTILPSTAMGMPPSATASSNTLLGRRKSMAVRALPSAAAIEPYCVLSILCSITMWPVLSRIAIAISQLFFAASASAAAIAFLAASSEIGVP